MKKIPSNKALTLSKTMNMDIWVVGTLNQLFIRGSKTETKFLKKSSCWQNLVLCNRFNLYSCTPYSICLNTDFFWQVSFVWKRCVFILSTFN